MTTVLTKEKIFALTNPQKFDNIMLKYRIKSYFQVRWYPYSHKIYFSLQICMNKNLEQVKKQAEKLKSRKMKEE